MTNDPSRSTSIGIHPRLTVVLVPGAPADVARAVADHVGDPGGPIDEAGVRAAAHEVAAAEQEVRAREHEETLSRLTVECEVATQARNAAGAAVAELMAQRTRAAGGARWCVEEGSAIAALAASLNDAEEVLGAARDVAARASARLDQVGEQRAAAKPVLEEARAELADLEASHLAEPVLRRELEQAVRTIRENERELGETLRRRADLESRTAEAAARLAALEADMAATTTVDARSVEVVRGALEAASAALAAPPDPAAAALAQTIAAADAEIARLAASGMEEPSAASVAEAAQRLAEARKALAEALTTADTRREAPTWWHEIGRLHAEVVEAEARLSRGRGSTRRAYEAAVAAERTMLDELGFDSYIDVLVSGGRRPGDEAHAARRRVDAEVAVAAAEAAAEEIRQQEMAAAPLIVARAERTRLIGEAAALLGVGPETVRDPTESLRSHRSGASHARARLADALAAVSVDAAADLLVPAASAWLGRHDATADPERDARAVESHVELVGEIARLEADHGAAVRQAEALAEAAEAARSTVGRLEGELRARVHGEGDPGRRALDAVALRDRISTLEAQLEQAAARAEADLADATIAVEAATVDRDKARTALLGLARHAGRLTAEIAPERRLAFDPLANIGALGDALRAEVDILAAEIAAAESGLAASAEELRAASAAVESHRDLPPAGQPTAEDCMAVFAEMLGKAATDAPCVVVEPLVTASPVVTPRLRDLLLRASAERPVVVLTADQDTVAWAIELPAHDGAVISLKTLVPDSETASADQTLAPR